MTTKAAFLEELMTGAAVLILEELVMGSPASVLEVLASGGCGETAVLVCIRETRKRQYGVATILEHE